MKKSACARVFVLCVLIFLTVTNMGCNNSEIKQDAIVSDLLNSQENILPLTEICDGKDNNGNGLIDEGTFVPSTWDGVAYAPGKFFGLANPHLYIVSGKYLFALDYSKTPAKLTSVLEISSLNSSDLFDDPTIILPESGYTAITTAPVGFFNLKADAFALVHGTNFYLLSLNENKLKGRKLTLETIFPDDTPTYVDALTTVTKQYFGFDGLLFITGNEVRILTPPNLVQKHVRNELFYPQGSTGAFPLQETINAASDIPRQYGFGVTSGNKLYLLSSINTDTTFSWEENPTSLEKLFPCD